MNTNERMKELLDRFALLRAMQQHADRNGRFSATDEQLHEWVNAYIHANTPLDAEDSSLLLALATQEKRPLWKASMEQLMFFVDTGAGIRDLKMFFMVMAMPKVEQQKFMEEVLKSLPPEAVKQIVKNVAEFEAQAA